MAHPQVLVKQMYDVFGMRKQSNVLYLGDICKDFTMSTLRSMEKIIEKHQNKDSYHMYIHARFDAVGKRTVKTIITLLPGSFDMEKFKTLGTMCFYVDNKAGVFRKLWVLPLDRPVLKGILDSAGAQPSIGGDAIGMPIKALVFN